MPFVHASSGAIVAEAEVLNLTPPSKIGTGICFLDHMVDQFTSHGQLGVTLRCGTAADGTAAAGGGKRGAPEAPTSFFAPARDYATGLSDRPHDRDIFIACGTAIGLALRRVVDEALKEADAHPGSASGVFCCPLDEAFAEARIDLSPPPELRGHCETKLAPYGKYSKSGGRVWIGRFRTEHTPLFWSALATGLQCDLSLTKVRGANAHHILESTFKSFARAFRATLDAIADGGSHGCAAPTEGPKAPAAPPPTPRRAERQRATKETTIEVRVDLDAPWLAADVPSGGGAAWTGRVMTASTLRGTVQPLTRIASGIAVLDRVLSALAQASGVELVARCEGDRHIDDHHTAEDVAITLGQCLHEALGDKAGLARMGCAEGASGKTRVRCILDLSNRPHFACDLALDEEYVGGEAGGEGEASASPWDSVCGGVLSCEMLHHVFDSLTLEMRATCHLQVLQDDTSAPGHTLDLALAAASAYGAALSRAIRVDPRRRGAVASSKGTLSK